MKHTSKLGLAMIGFVLSSAAFAGELDEKKGKRHGPPPVAIEACVAAVDGDACSFEGRHGDALSGQCATDKEEVLACRLEGGSERLHRHDAQHAVKDAVKDAEKEE